MACSPSTTPFEHMLNWEFFDAVWCTYVGPSSVTFVALAVFGPLMLAYYVHGDSLKIPVVLAIILGGVIGSQVPGGMTQLAILGVLALLAVGGYLVTQRLEG